MKIIVRAGAATAAGLLAGGLALVGPAAATEPGNSITAEVGDCGEVTITYTNGTDFHYWGDYKVGDQEGMADADYEVPVPSIGADPDAYEDAHDHGIGPMELLGDYSSSPYAEEIFGYQYNPLVIAPGESVTATVGVDEDTTVAYRIWRGPEHKNYVPWSDVEVGACEETTPPTTDPTDPPDGKGGEQEEEEEALPETGASTGMLAAGAVTFAVLGGGLYWLARRRRFSFSA